MKNYATPCAFYGTKEELYALIEPLKGLGYEISLTIDGYGIGNILVTNWEGRNGKVNFVDEYSRKNHNRISAPASNIPLCLALAAMVEGDQPSDGEIYVMEKAGGWGYDQTNNGCLAIVKYVSEFLGRAAIDGTVLNPKEHTFFVEFKNVPLVDKSGIPIIRKATVPEIFAHFGVPFQQVEEKKEEVREIVGYKAPFDIYTHSEKWIICKGDLMIETDNFYYKSDRWESQLDYIRWSLPKEIVETWEPLYKEVKKIRVEAGEYTKEELQQMIEGK